MCLRKYCNIQRCKVILWTRINLFSGAFGVQNKNMHLNRLDSNTIQQSAILNISRKSGVVIFSKMQYCQGNRNDGGKSNKSISAEEDGNKQAQDQNTTQIKSATAAQNKSTEEVGKKQAQDQKATAQNKSATAAQNKSTEDGKKLAQDQKATTQNKSATAAQNKSTEEDGKKKAQDQKATTQNKSTTAAQNKSTVEDGKKLAQDQKATTQNKSATAARNKGNTAAKIIKPFRKPKSRNPYSLRNQKTRIVALLLGIAGVFYYTHLVVDPITERRKVHFFSEKQTKTLGSIQSDHFKKKYKNRIETSGKNYDRVSKIVTTLMAKNSDLIGAEGERTWTIFIIDNDESVNSVVLANGDIFVYSGLLQETSNDDHLAAVLAHEIAHVLLNHSAEVPTWKRKFLSMCLYPMLVVYGILPTFFGSLIFPFLSRLSVITMKRPMGYKLEDEADSLSMEIVPKACYDPRAVKEFWKAMENLQKNRSVKLLWAHPNSKSRYHHFDSLMPKAFNILQKRCVGNDHPFFR